MSYQFELAVRQYIAAFDGTMKVSQAEFEHLFDKVHHKDYIFVGIDGKTGTRDELLETESKNLANGAKVTLIHFKKIGLDCVDIKVRVENEHEDTTVHVVNTVKDGQAIVARVIDDSTESNLFFLTTSNLSSCGSVLKAKWASSAYKWMDFGTYGTNM